MTPLRYSELTPDLIAALRILAALEVTYPQHGDKASRTLAGWKAWREKQARGHLRGQRNPGIDPDPFGLANLLVVEKVQDSARELAPNTSAAMPKSTAPDHPRQPECPHG